jgi:hypothetical protein
LKATKESIKAKNSNGAPILSMLGILKNFVPTKRSASITGNENEFEFSKKD